MPFILRLSIILITLCVAGGCSITGEWKTLRVEPADCADAFAFAAVTFDDDGFYIATVTSQNRRTNPRGKYEWHPWTGRLVVKPREGEPRSYTVRFSTPRRVTARTTCADGRAVRGVLTRVDKE